MSKIIRLGRFYGRLLGPLMKDGLLLMKKVIKPITKKVLTPLGLLAAALATDAAIQKEIQGPRGAGMFASHPLDLAQRTAGFIISNKQIS